MKNSEIKQIYEIITEVLSGKDFDTNHLDDIWPKDVEGETIEFFNDIIELMIIRSQLKRNPEQLKLFSEYLSLFAAKELMLKFDNLKKIHAIHTEIMEDNTLNSELKIIEYIKKTK
jgi:hypothetical protein